MLNINDLEAKHTKYKLKSYIPYITIIISLIAIIVSVITVFKYNTKSTINSSSTITAIEHSKIKKEVIKPDPIVDKNEKIVDKPKVVIQTIVENSKAQAKTSKKEKLTLSPSLSFMRKIQGDSVQYYEKSETENKKEETSYTKKQTVNKTKEIKKIKQPIVAEDKSTIKIKKQNTYSDISHVLKRFKVNNNPALSLFVAKKYYQLGDYNKAYNYALITNGINNNIEASWIIFAKSLIKLNKKDEAINTLKKYINHSSSSQAKILLDEILSGKFK